MQFQFTSASSNCNTGVQLGKSGESVDLLASMLFFQTLHSIALLEDVKPVTTHSPMKVTNLTLQREAGVHLDLQHSTVQKVCMED